MAVPGKAAHPHMAGAGFGEHLKREREMRGVSLEEIAGATRISTRFLEALEQEAWDRLPGGVFNRGFVRTVARFLGLEEESLLAEYSLATGTGSAPPPVATQLRTRPSADERKLPWMAYAAIPVLLMLAAGGWFGWQWLSARRSEMDAAAASLPATPAPPSAPSNLWTASTDSPNASSISTQDPQSAASPWADSGQSLQLRIDAARDTALTVTSDGQPAFAGVIAAGQNRTISAKTALTVEAQDAGAIHLELNGQAVAPIGPSGQPGRVTFGRPSAPTDTGGHD
jgi:cytoskeletal protein RodZ